MARGVLPRDDSGGEVVRIERGVVEDTPRGAERGRASSGCRAEGWGSPLFAVVENNMLERVAIAR